MVILPNVINYIFGIIGGKNQDSLTIFFEKESEKPFLLHILDYFSYNFPEPDPDMIRVFEDHNRQILQLRIFSTGSNHRFIIQTFTLQRI